MTIVQRVGFRLNLELAWKGKLSRQRIEQVVAEELAAPPEKYDALAFDVEDWHDRVERIENVH
jgi:hypothetical protein